METVDIPTKLELRSERETLMAVRELLAEDKIKESVRPSGFFDRFVDGDTFDMDTTCKDSRRGYHR